VKTEDVLRQIATVAEQQHTEVYAVGGYVRDLLLNKHVKDIDFVVVGDGVKFAKAVKDQLNARDLVVYERFGTAMLNLFEHKLEFVGARTEQYAPDSRKPEVTSADLAADLLRRDFTINALAMRIQPENFGEIMDPLNGREDLQRKLIRTPLNPEETFREDPLRIMRAIRFVTQLKFDLDNATFRALSEMRDRLRIISQERITDELMKILAADRPSTGFKLMNDSGVLEVVLPEIEAMKGVEQRGKYHHKDVFFHTLKVIDNVARLTDSVPLRFAALVHDIGKPKTKLFKDGVGWTFHGHDEVGARMLPQFCQRLKLPNDLLKFAQKMVRLHLRPISLTEEEVTDSAVRRLMVHAGEDIESLLLLCRADITSGNPGRVKQHLANFDYVVQRMQEVEEKDTLRAFQSPVRGDEIMKVCQLEPGPRVGQLKNLIEEAILDGLIPYDHDAALEYLIAHQHEAD